MASREPAGAGTQTQWLNSAQCPRALAVEEADDELALVTVPPHTTARRGQRRGLALPKTFLRSGAFHLQQVQSGCVSRLERRLGLLAAEEWTTVQYRLPGDLGL